MSSESLENELHRADLSQGLGVGGAQTGCLGCTLEVHPIALDMEGLR